MVFSMTGFGRAKQNISDFDISVEIRSVNHRYFEYSSRLPRAYMFIDDKLKSLCQQYISRGKVEVSVFIENNNPNKVSLEINEEYANAYFEALHRLAKKYKLKKDFKLSTFATNQELFSLKRAEVDEEALLEAVLSTAQLAVKAFCDMRAEEGKRLVDDVNSRLNTILNAVSFIEERSPETLKEYRERLEQKMRELLDDKQIDEQRLLTETAIFADKIAVAEETVRLRSHIKALSDLFLQDGAIGRKIDFIVQEMNREANTIGSKAQDIDIAKTVVDIKSEIEKIREQIQNIE